MTLAPNQAASFNPTFYADGLGQYHCTPNNANSTFTSGYYVNVPTSYNVNTPETLVVALHGCGGTAYSDISEESQSRTRPGTPTDYPFIMLAPQGPDAGYNAAAGGPYPGPACWNPAADDLLVLRDIYLAETQFNINRHRVILLGYSSGGDLGYSTILRYSREFAGMLAQNTNPWTQNDIWQGSEASTLSFVTNTLKPWRFNIRHVETTGDDTYLPAGQQAAFNDLWANGWSSGATANHGQAVLLDTPGGHYNDDVCNGVDNGCTTPANAAHCTPAGYTTCYGTYYDIVDYLLASVGTDGWSSP